MLSLRTAVCCFAFAGLLLIGSSDSQARPQYGKAFPTEYPKLAEQAKEAKCGLCHPGKSKKMRNSYGMAVGAGLGMKNQKNAKMISAALKGAESKKSDVEGKTFGDLIKEGKLPNAK